MRRSFGSCRGFRRGAVALAVMSCFYGNAALANPAGAQVVSGAAQLTTTGNLLSITNTPNAIINWNSFSIGANEITRFVQQSASSAVLNRVVGQNPSSILGALQSNGRVFLINPNGIVFGAGSQINVAGLVASSLNLSNEDFLAGRMRFTEGLGNSVINNGNIATASGGNVYMIGNAVTNNGIITSPKGEVILAAGNRVELVNPGTPDLRVEILAPDNQALNLGQIAADSGRIGIYAGLINHSGAINADSVVVGESGQIMLKASQNATLAAGSSTTANGPGGGTVTVQSGDATLVSGTIDARGTAGAGGNVQVLGNRVGLIERAGINVSGAADGGTVLVGGDFQGMNPAVQNAARTYVGADVTIKADAIDNGDGGKVIVWADEVTRAYGSVSARGGVHGGNGGFVEVSGKQWLDFATRVDTRAPKGTAGTLLLDPYDVNIIAGSSTSNINCGNYGCGFGSADASTTNLNVSALVIALANNSVEVHADNRGVGDINVLTPIIYNSPYSFGLYAGRDINIIGNNIIGGGGIGLIAGRDVNITGATVKSGYQISFASSGNVNITGATVQAAGPIWFQMYNYAPNGVGTPRVDQNINLIGGLAPTLVEGGQINVGTNYALRLQGGSEANSFVLLSSLGTYGSAVYPSQSIVAREITLTGGSGASASAEIRHSGNGNQVFSAASITLTGGSGDNSYARIRSDGVGVQSINYGQSFVDQNGKLVGKALPVITLTGGAASQGNSASISTAGTQSISANTIAINAGAGGIDNSASISAAGQTITTTGDVSINGGGSSGSVSGARIGGPAGQVTNLTLSVGGDLLLTGGPSTGANIGTSRSGLSDTNMLINVGGSLLSTNTGAGTNRIGSPGDALGGGNITINAGTGGAGDIVLSGRSQLRTLGDVTINTPGKLALTGGSSGANSQALIHTGNHQYINASHITVTGGAGGINNAARIQSDGGYQGINTGGTVILQGGAEGSSARIVANGDQGINAAGILVAGGDGSNSFAEILQTSKTANQWIDTGNIAVAGGAGTQNSYARIRSNGMQSINVARVITIVGGASGGVAGQSNSASISAGNWQSISANTIAIGAGAGGIDNAATISAASQFITTVGDVYITGGSSGGTFGGARIGGPADQATNLTLNVGGDLLLTGGPSTGANIGTSRSGLSDTNMLINVGGSLLSTNTGAGTNRIGSPGDALGGGNITINAGTGGAGDIVLAGRSQLRSLGDVTINTPGKLALKGGSSGADSQALIHTGGNQWINASRIAVTGGAGGINNAAHIQSDQGNQTIFGSPEIVLTGGTGGAPDQGNGALIQATKGSQSITSGDLILKAGGPGYNNFATIAAPVQNITVHGDLAMTGGASLPSTTTGGGARIGGVGGANPSPTALSIFVDGNASLKGGIEAYGGSVIGSDRSGGQRTDIGMSAVHNVTLNSGNTGSWIGSPLSNMAGGDIFIWSLGTISLNSTGAGSYIRTLDSVTLDAYSVIQLASAGISANALTTRTWGGAGMTGNANWVSSFNATNSKAGDIALVNNSSILTVTGVNQISSGKLVISQAGDLVLSGYIASGPQVLSAGGHIALGSPGWAAVHAEGTQTIKADGTLYLPGSAGNSAITANGNQSIDAADIVVRGGNGYSQIVQKNSSATQTITATHIEVTAGAAGTGRYAHIRSNGAQVITGAPTITLNGGDAGTNNTAVITAAAEQVINASLIEITGGAGGTNNSATITAAMQQISTIGDVDIRGSSGNVGGARIGGLEGVATNLTLNVGGDLLLTGGPNAGASLGASRSGFVDTNMLINVGGSMISTNAGATTNRIGSPGDALGGGTITINAGTSGVGDIVLSGRSQLRTLGEVMINTPGTLAITGGSSGINNSQALIHTGGNQTISASRIAVTGGAGGINNFAHIQSENGNQTISGSSEITLIGGAGGAPDLGNNALIRANSGTQTIASGGMKLNAGRAGYNNFASIQAPTQVIMVRGDLAMNGGDGFSSATSGSGARIGGVSSVSSTNLTLNVDGNVTMNGGSQPNAGATIGSNLLGGQLTVINMSVGGNLSLNPGTAADAGARIGSPFTNVAGGNISVKVGGNITLGGSSGLGTSIRTQDTVDLTANSITQSANAAVVAAAFNTRTSNGATLIGGNQVLRYHATNSPAGEIKLFNTASKLTVNGIDQSAQGALTIAQTGDLVLSGTISSGPQSISATGNITLVPNSPVIVRAYGAQSIHAGGVITVQGKDGDTDSFAQITSSGAQAINASKLVVGGGTGSNNFAEISAPSQSIAVTGDVTLAGGSTANTDARIGGLGGTNATTTNLSLNAGGNVTLAGGGSGAAIGSDKAGGQATNIALNVAGNVNLAGGIASDSAVRIGSPSTNVAGGTVTVTSGGNIALGAGTAIQTTQNVTLSATGSGSAVTQDPGALIQAQVLVVTSSGGVNLGGSNQVSTVTVASTGSGDLVFSTPIIGSGDLAFTTKGAIIVNDTTMVSGGSIKLEAASLQVKGVSKGALVQAAGDVDVKVTGELRVQSVATSRTIGGSAAIVAQGGGTADDLDSQRDTRGVALLDRVAGHGKVDITAGSVVLKGGDGVLSYAMITGGPINLNASGNVSLKGGKGLGSAAWMLSSQSIDLTVGGKLMLDAGVGLLSFARLQTVRPTDSIQLYFPNLTTGGFSVNGFSGASQNGASGFYTGPAAAKPGKRLIIKYRK